jgi:hypothetical protein
MTAASEQQREALEPPNHTLLSCPRCDAVWAYWPKDTGGDARPFLNVRSKTWCGWCERASVDELVPAEYVSAPARADYGMVDAAIRCSNEWPRGTTDFAGIYRAMLDAAPRAPEAGVPSLRSADTERHGSNELTSAPEFLSPEVSLLLRQAAEALEDVIGWVPGRAAWHHDSARNAVERARSVAAALRQRMGRE